MQKNTGAQKEMWASIQKHQRWILAGGILSAMILVVILGLTGAGFTIVKSVRDTQEVSAETAQIDDILHDVGILNVLLAAEDLEQAIYGPLTSAICGNGYGTTCTNQKGTAFNGTDVCIQAGIIGGDEQGHSRYLRHTAIPYYCGMLPVALQSSCVPTDPCQYQAYADGFFEAAGIAAAVESVGEGLYAEAVSLAKIPEVRKLLGGILAVEAEHAAYWRVIVGTNSSPVQVVKSISFADVLCDAAAFVSNADTCAPWSSRVCATD